MGTLSFWLLTAIQILSGHFDQRGSMLMTRQQQRTAKLAYPHRRRHPDQALALQRIMRP